MLPFKPKDTLFELLNTIADRLFDVVPPERFTADNNPTVLGTVYDAVTVLAFSPNEIPFEFENVRADKLPEVVPALKLILEIKPAVLGTV